MIILSHRHYIKYRSGNSYYGSTSVQLLINHRTMCSPSQYIIQLLSYISKKSINPNYICIPTEITFANKNNKEFHKNSLINSGTFHRCIINKCMKICAKNPCPCPWVVVRTRHLWLSHNWRSIVKYSRISHNLWHHFSDWTIPTYCIFKTL